ncbi:MAG TPA: hypothetical protein VLC52_06940 [Anaerolineae bacterium]|nr:hypothetical protein [Anaerolineae bacterium]
MNRRGDGGRGFLPLSRWQVVGRAARPAIVILVAFLVLSACAENPPARLGSIPGAPSYSVEIPEDVLPFDRAAVVDSIQGLVGAGTVDVRVYVVPVDTGFQTLESHYHAFLDTDWQVQETPAVAAAQAQGRSAVLWSNPQTGEILSLQYMPAPGYDGNLLIVLYASKEQTWTPGPEAAYPA